MIMRWAVLLYHEAPPCVSLSTRYLLAISRDAAASLLILPFLCLQLLIAPASPPLLQLLACQRCTCSGPLSAITDGERRRLQLRPWLQMLAHLQGL